MTAEELWKESGLNGEYSAWAFGDDADQLAQFVRTGLKKATCSLLCFYESEGEPLPQTGEYSVILNSHDEAICIIRTTNVYITTFDKVSEKHAFLEGEDDRTLDQWKKTHQEFFTQELKTVGRSFSNTIELVCEEFEVVFPVPV